jgi:hypothetical protein
MRARRAGQNERGGRQSLSDAWENGARPALAQGAWTQGALRTNGKDCTCGDRPSKAFRPCRCRRPARLDSETATLPGGEGAFQVELGQPKRCGRSGARASVPDPAAVKAGIQRRTESAAAELDDICQLAQGRQSGKVALGVNSSAWQARPGCSCCLGLRLRRSIAAMTSAQGGAGYQEQSGFRRNERKVQLA